MNKKIVIAITMMIAGAGYLIFSSFMDNKISYLSINDLQASPNKYMNKELKITGLVVADSLEEKLLEKGKVYRFKIKDKMDQKNPKTVVVTYQGVLPDSFAADIDIVCTGHLSSDGTFNTRTMITKCPSKYEEKDENGKEAGYGKGRPENTKPKKQ